MPHLDLYWGSPKTHKEKWNTTMYSKIILDSYESYDEVISAENNLIGESFKTDPLCLNCHNNVNFNTQGLIVSDETKRKIGDANRQRRLGKKHSEETREKMRKSHKNRDSKQLQKFREAGAAARRGKRTHIQN